MRDRLLVLLYVLVLAAPLGAMFAGVKDARIGGVIAQPVDDAHWAERTQKRIENWFDAKRGLRGWSIWIDNTILANVFGEAKWGSRAMLGPDGILFERDDIAYFNRSGDELPTEAELAVLAERIARLQKRFAARGQALVPVLVPSKTTIYRDAVPSLWTRDLGDPRPGTTRVYHGLLRELTTRGVVHVDGIALTLETPVALDVKWGPSARHWSNYIGCLVVGEVIVRHAKLTGRPAVPYPCGVEMQRAKRTDGDLDLHGLVNAWGVPRDRFKREVIRPGAERGGARVTLAPDETRLGMMTISGSFGWVLMGDAELSGRFDRLFIDYYNSTVHSPFAAAFPAEPTNPAYYDAFLAQDIVIVELNESYVVPKDYFVATALATLERVMDETKFDEK